MAKITYVLVEEVLSFKMRGVTSKLDKNSLNMRN